MTLILTDVRVRSRLSAICDLDDWDYHARIMAECGCDPDDIMLTVDMDEAEFWRAIMPIIGTLPVLRFSAKAWIGRRLKSLGV